MFVFLLHGSRSVLVKKVDYRRDVVDAVSVWQTNDLIYSQCTRTKKLNLYNSISQGKSINFINFLKFSETRAEREVLEGSC